MKQYKEFLEEMRILRYKKPSWNNILGIIQLKKQIKKATGINRIQRLKPARIKQRLLQQLGVYGNERMTTVRQLGHGKIRTPFKVLPEDTDA